MSALSAEQLARELAPMLLPLLPYLIKGGKIATEAAAKALGKKVGEEIPSTIKALWEKIRPAIDDEPGANALFNRAAENPDDNRMLPALELQLENILENELLRSEIIHYLQLAREQGVQIDSSIKLRKSSGEVLGVEIQDMDALKDIKEIRSGIEVEESKKGSQITSVRIGNQNKSEKQN